MKISIITVCLNSAKTIESTIQSVLSQNYPEIEYIIIDGGSTDGTTEIINRYRPKINKVVSEKDNGIYDAINKGILLTTGDIIGNINSDDFYASSDVIEKVVKKMVEKEADVCWGDLVYVDRYNPDKIVRRWESSGYKDDKFKSGWMPPHPTFFVRRQVYNGYGLFNTDFKIAADYELMLRFLENHRVKSCYIPETLVKMRIGGKTQKSIRNIRNVLRYKWEDYRAWGANGLRVNPINIIFRKSFSKISQLNVR